MATRTLVVQHPDGRTETTTYEIPDEEDRRDRMFDAIAKRIDDLEPLVTKQAWAAMAAADRWLVVRRAIVLMLKLARLQANRLDSAGGDDS
jgi:hypothetical protein